MHIHRLMAIALIATSVALVGCGGGGGGSSKKASSTNTPSTTPIVQEDDQQNNVQAPPEEEVADSGDPVTPELLLPVDTSNPGGDDLAFNPDSNEPGQIAANPEPASAALAAMGLAFLATRRYGRREA